MQQTSVRGFFGVKGAMSQSHSTISPNAIFCFSDFTWHRFDPLAAVESLLSTKEAFFAEKQIIFSAFAAWAVDPDNDELRKLAIARQVALQLIHLEAEQPTEYNIALNNVLRQIKQHSEPDVAAFFEQAYFPIGGLKTIVSTYAAARFHERRAKASGGINTAIQIVSIYHYHAINFLDEKSFYQPSLSKAAELLSKAFNQKPTRGEGGANADNIKKQWRRCRNSVCLAYAAASLPVDDIKYSDLLDVMQQGRASWEKHGRLLPRLLSRTRYIEDNVLSRCYKNEGSPYLFGSLPNISVQPFRPRNLSADEEQRVFGAFARRPGVKKST